MHDLESLPDVLTLLMVSIFTVVTLRKFKLSPVLGYLIVGACIGKHGMDLIREPQYTEVLGEFGVVFLLFVIGLELTFERLIKMRRFVFGFGGLQMLLTALVLTSIFYFIQSKLSYYIPSPAILVVIALALSLSSTAIVLQVLAENRTQSSQVGRLSLAVLLMQDFAVVPLLAVIPILTESEHIIPAMGIASIKALITIVAITVCGRLFLRPFFSIIASVKTDEVYLTTALLIVLGAAWITHNMQLSTAMGAFIAGLLIAETEYRNRIEDSITPFQGLFTSLFFLSVGMSIDWRFILTNLANVLLVAGVLIFIKAFIIFILCLIFRLEKGASINAALLLSQGGEFAFILFNLAAKQGVVHQDLAQFLLMVVAVTMAITPLLAIIGNAIEDKFGLSQTLDDQQEFKGVSDLRGHVILAGFGRVGKVVAYMLTQEQISYIAIDSNAGLAKKAKNEGFPVYHGDLSDIETLRGVGVQRASAVILSMSDKPSIRKAVKTIAGNYTELPLISRVEDLKHSRGIKKLGATSTVATTVETGIQLGSAALRGLGVVELKIAGIKDKIRKNNYTLSEEADLFN